jgi:hypothetical protein
MQNPITFETPQSWRSALGLRTFGRSFPASIITKLVSLASGSRVFTLQFNLINQLFTFDHLSRKIAEWYGFLSARKNDDE